MENVLKTLEFKSKLDQVYIEFDCGDCGELHAIAVVLGHEDEL